MITVSESSDYLGILLIFMLLSAMLCLEAWKRSVIGVFLASFLFIAMKLPCYERDV